MSVTWDDTVSDGEKGTHTWANSIIAGIKRRGPKYVVTTDSYGDYQCDGTDDDVQIQQALDALTAGRSSKEKVLLRGNFVIGSPVTIPSYTILEIDGKITAKSGLNDNILENSDQASGNTQIKIIGGELDGNKANQTNLGVDTDQSNINFVKVTDFLISNVYSHDAEWSGIFLYNTCADGFVEKCVCNANDEHGITLWSSSGINVSNCICDANDRVGINLHTATKCVIHGNTCINSVTGSNIVAHTNSNYCVISDNYVENAATHGIDIENNTLGTLVLGNEGYNNANVGIYFVNSPYSVCVGNKLDQRASGITVLTGSECLINGNTCYSCSSRGILLQNTEYNTVIGNHITGCTEGIGELLTAGSCDNNRIMNNRLYNNTTTATIIGANTQIPSVVAPFVDGTIADDRGWDVDAGGEYARSYLRLPHDVQAVVRLYIYAHSVVTEADAMELDINVNGGADNEAYNTHAYAGSGVDSASTNFAADDVIYWGPITDAAITALLGGDSVEVKVVHAAIAGDNCATDARFRTVEIQYV